MSDKLDLILSKLEGLEQTVETIKMEQKQQGDLLVQLIGIVKSTNEKVSELAKSQEKQDRILETLALRSLEQETEIREIKRIK